jgi:N-methylhydantoinase B/oxoprolinase/acetone carboxylase alpha subunit
MSFNGRMPCRLGVDIGGTFTDIVLMLPYTFTDYIDNDSISSEPVVINVALTVRGDSAEVDFEGSSPQVPGGINSPLPFTKSAVYGALRLAMDPAIPSSAGYFRAITVHAPEPTSRPPRSAAGTCEAGCHPEPAKDPLLVIGLEVRILRRSSSG